MKLNVKALAWTGGILWALTLFVIAWWLLILGRADAEPTLLERMYPGYAFTPLGSVIGLGWGFADGLLSGALVAWVYNRFASRRDRDS